MSGASGLVILGFGGHARSVAAVALHSGFKSILFIDRNAKKGESFLGFPATRELEGNLSKDWSCIPGVGDNRKRAEQYEFVSSMGWALARVIAKNATIDVGATISPGCFIGHHAHVGPLAQIGSGCIINTGAIVEHESSVGNFSHVSVNSVVAGRTQIGNYVFVGAGATVIDSVSVGDNITIGAGSTVIDSLTIPGTYAGRPARPI